jgi:WD40-like Beta Propeller Repeat
MTLRYRFGCATLGFALVALMTTDPTATPAFSAWSVPLNLGPTINSAYIDAGPAISKDALSLYFTSDRPGGYGSVDIWVSQRVTVDAPWGSPQNLGPIVNTGALDAIPALSRDGHWLFFNSTRDGGFGQLDLWASYRANIHDDFAWETPVNLGPGVNSAFADGGAAFFENDEAGPPMLFFASTRPGGFGGFDIYKSAVTADGTFGPATLVPELSSPANDRRPSVRFDGGEVFFDSDRVGSLGSDLWVSTPWSTPVNLGMIVNSAADDNFPNIAADREHLYFASTRPGGFGGFDLYVTSRKKLQGH